MAVQSTNQRLLFTHEPALGIEDEPEQDLFDDGVQPIDSFEVSTFPHISGQEGLGLSIVDTIGEAHFFLTPAGASQLRRWLNDRNF